MTIEIRERVEVDVKLGTLPQITASFDIPMVLVGTEAFTEPYRNYTTLSAVGEDFAENSPAYKMATLLFNGNSRPSEIIIGKRGVTNWTLTPTVANNTAYSIELVVDGVSIPVSYTSDADAVDTEIVAGLTAAIAASAANGKVTVTGTTTLVLAPNGVNTLDVAPATTNLASVITYDETAVTAATAIRLLDTSWVVAMSDDHTEASVLALAAYLVGIGVKYLTSSQDADIQNPVDTANIAVQLKNLNYGDVGLMYDTEADSRFPEAALFGSVASLVPGTYTLEYQNLVGVPVRTYTAAERSVMDDRNVIYYVNWAGFPSVFNSKVSDGNFWDTSMFKSWLQARIGEAVAGLIVRKSRIGSKVDYQTEGGILEIKSAISHVVQQGIRLGSIDATTDLTTAVRAPTREEVSVADRANRHLPDVVVDVIYTNAIHSVKVTAYVSI